MKFKVLVGKAQHGGKLYRKGDVIDVDFDLVAKHGKGKFERIHEEEGFAAPQASPRQKAQKAAATEADSDDTAAATESTLGEDVTADFPEAAKQGLKVFRSGAWYHVATEDDPNTAVNEKALHKADVAKFVREFEG